MISARVLKFSSYPVSVRFLFLITKHKTLEFTHIKKIKDMPLSLGAFSVRTVPDAARGLGSEGVFGSVRA